MFWHTPVELQRRKPFSGGRLCPASGASYPRAIDRQHLNMGRWRT